MDATQIVAAVNTALVERPDQGDYPDFVTLCYGHVRRVGLDTIIDLVRAGHLPPLVRRADGAVEEIDVPGQLLGVYPHPLLPVHRVVLHPGDSLLLVTDGITESRAPGGELFGERRLRDAVARARPGPDSVARPLLDTIVDAVRVHTSDDAATAPDDRAIVVLVNRGD